MGTGCSSNNKYLKKAIYSLPISNCYSIYPILLKHTDSLKNSELFSIITSSDDLYSRLNIQAVDFPIFCHGIYMNAMKYTPVKINNNLYHDCVNRKIIPSTEIEQLYNTYGIITVLNKYLDDNGWLLKYLYIEKFDNANYHGKDVNVDYIIYLAAKHNIYFNFYDLHVPGEPIGYQITLSGSEKGKLKGLKTVLIP